MSWNPLTFSSRKLHLSYDLLLHSCSALSIFATANLLCLNSISLFFACSPFSTQCHPIDYQKPYLPFRRPRTSQESQGPKPKPEATSHSKPLEVLASWQITPCSAQAPPTKFNESFNASGEKLGKPPCIQVHDDTTPGQPPWLRAQRWVGLAVAMSAFPWCEARSILAHRSHDVINPAWSHNRRIEPCGLSR